MGADGWWVKVVCEVVVEGGGRDVGGGLEKEKGDEKGGFEILFRLSWLNEKYCNV